MDESIEMLQRAVSRSVEFMEWSGSHISKWVVLANIIGSAVIIIMGLIVRFGSKKELTTLQKKSCNGAFIFGGITLLGVIIIWIMTAINHPIVLVMVIFLLIFIFFFRVFVILIWNHYISKNLPNTGVSQGLNIIMNILCLPDLIFFAYLSGVLLFVIVICLICLIVPIKDPNLVTDTIKTFLKYSIKTL